MKEIARLTIAFLAICLFVAGVAFVGGRKIAAKSAPGWSPQANAAIAQLAANVGSAVSYYDLGWDDPPQDVIVVKDGGATSNSVVRMTIRLVDNSASYSGGNEIHHVFVLQGTVKPSGKLVGKIKTIRSTTWRAKAS